METSFAAAIDADDEVAAQDLALSLRQGRSLSDVAGRGGSLDVVGDSGARHPIEFVGSDFVAVSGPSTTLLPLSHLVLARGRGPGPRRTPASMLEVLRAVARERGRVVLDLRGEGSHRGRLLAAGPDHVWLETPVGELLVGLAALASVGFEDGVDLG